MTRGLRYLDIFKGIEERLEEIMDIKIESFYLYALQKFINIIKFKIICNIFIEIFIISFCFYYILIFSIVYNNSQISLFINYLLSLLESLVTSLVISLIIVVIRKFGILYLNNRAYNVSKYLNNHF